MTIGSRIRRAKRERIVGYERIDGRRVKVSETKNYKRYRVREPEQFKKTSFRTLDIGRPKKHQMVRGKLKRTERWATQAVIVEKPAPKKETREIVKKAVKYQ